MYKQFLDLLCCPETREPMRLEADETHPNGMVTSGALVGPSGRRYPIIRGVPRFVGVEHYAASFGFEWNRWPRLQFDDQNVGRPLEGHTTRMWETITGVTGDLPGKTLVEFGCGPGRFLDVARRKGAHAVGIDLSQAVEAARRNFSDDPDVLIVQGDIFNPPFRAGSFDGGFSIGVLHHTPDPARGLRTLAQTVRSGGWVACSVYPNYGFYAYRSVARHRKLYNFLKPVFGYGPALLYTYLSAHVLAPLFRWSSKTRGLRRITRYLETNWLPVLHYLLDARWRLLDTFDGITPAIATTHTGDEVAGWMARAGCTDVQTTEWGETAVHGVKEGGSA